MKEFCRDRYVWLSLMVTVLSMAVLLAGGFYMDDSVLSYLTRAKAADAGIWNYIGENITSWLHQGRIFPISNIYVSFLMCFVPNAFVYKLIILIFVLLDVYVMGLFVWRMSGQKSVAYLAMGAMPLLFQIRYYHDGIVGYHLLMQIIILVILLSALALNRYMESRKKSWLVLSLGLYTAGILTYEIGFVGIFVLCFVAFCHQKEGLKSVFTWKNVWKTVKNIMPFFLITIAVLALTMYVKGAYGTGYDGVQVSMEPGKIAGTACKQALAAFPLSYFLLAKNMGYAFERGLGTFIKNVRPVDIAAVAVFLFVLYKKCGEKIRIHTRPLLWGVALVLWWVPSLIIGMSAKYQTELFWGIGHIPVYVEYFGIMLFALLLFSFCLSLIKNEKARKVFSGIIYAGLGLVMMINLQNNRIVTGLLNETYKYSRDLLDASFKDGFLEDVPEGAVLIVENPKIYLDYPGTDYISFMAGKKVNVTGPDDYTQSVTAGFSGKTTIIPNENTFILTYEYEKEAGSITLARVEEIRLSDDGDNIEEYYVNHISCYEKGENLEKMVFCTENATNDEGEERETLICSLPFEELEKTEGKHGDIYTYVTDENVQYNSLKVFDGEDEEVSFETAFDGDFYTEEGSMRWCGYRGRVRITSYKEAESEAVLTFRLGTNSKGTVTVQAKINDETRTYVLEAGKDQEIVLESVLKPGNNYLEFSAEGEPLGLEYDGRTLLFRVHDFTADNGSK